MNPYNIGDKVVFVDRLSSNDEKTCMRLGEIVGGQAYRVSTDENPVWEYVIKGANDAIFTVNRNDVI